jgi:release factor glutamine methyltransferase
MPLEPLYSKLLAQLTAGIALSPDLPDETFDATLRALWQAAAGTPCSAHQARELPLQDLTDLQSETLTQLVEERISGVPLAHLTGRVSFMGLELLAEPGVLIPRPETEILGNAVVSLARELCATRDSILIVEIGCGSGNLACGIAVRVPEVRIISIDVSPECVELTRKNVQLFRIDERVTVLLGDLFLPLKGRGIEETVDIVVSNPPYIPSGKLATDHSRLVVNEPREAFDGGPFGFAIHNRLIKESIDFLKPGGTLMFEFGLGQDRQVGTLFARSEGYEPVQFAADAAGRNRIALAKKRY